MLRFHSSFRNHKTDLPSGIAEILFIVSHKKEKWERGIARPNALTAIELPGQQTQRIETSGTSPVLASPKYDLSNTLQVPGKTTILIPSNQNKK